MQKKILFLAVLIICAAIWVPGTLAYFTTEEQVHNIITSDAVDVEIQEWQESETGKEPIAYPDKHPIKLIPGIPVSKIVKIKNLDAECYIRAKYEFVIMDTYGNVLDLPQETMNSMISVVLNTEAWMQKSDEDIWWYYNAPVGKEEITEAFFTEVIFDGPNITNEYQNCMVQVNVAAQAVQKVNNGDRAVEAEGWPEE